MVFITGSIVGAKLAFYWFFIHFVLIIQMKIKNLLNFQKASVNDMNQVLMPT